MALATFAVLVGMERRWPHSPAPLVAVGGAIAASWLVGLDRLGVSTVGLIPQGLPAPTLPDLQLIGDLAPGALGIALMSFTETIAAGQAFAKPGEPRIDANRELVAVGARQPRRRLPRRDAGGGGTSQTAVVRSAGGRSQKASLVTAAAAGDDAAARPAARPDAQRDAGRGGDRLFGRAPSRPAEFRAIRAVRTMEFRWALCGLRRGARVRR